MRFFSVNFQFYTALALLYAGFLSTGLYDLTLPLCRGCGSFLRALCDWFLCATTTLMIFLALYLSGSSAIRFYMPFALAAGAMLYHVSVHKFLIVIVKCIKGNRKKRSSGE